MSKKVITIFASAGPGTRSYAHSQALTITTCFHSCWRVGGGMRTLLTWLASAADFEYQWDGESKGESERG